jgi:hypothetical protein
MIILLKNLSWTPVQYSRRTHTYQQWIPRSALPAQVSTRHHQEMLPSPADVTFSSLA